MSRRHRRGCFKHIPLEKTIKLLINYVAFNTVFIIYGYARSQTRVRGQSKVADISLLSLRAELTPHTSSHGSTSFLAGEETTSDGESENPAGLQNIRVERNGTSDASSSSSSAALPKICGCLSLCFNKCRGTQSDSDDRDSSEDLSTDIPDYEIYKMHIKFCTAIRACDLAQVKQLLAEGVSATHLLDGDTALHYCIRMYGRYSLGEDTEGNRIRMKIFEEILAVAVRTKDLDSPNYRGETPLYSAIGAGSLKLVEALVKAGARMENISNDASTVLHVAAQYLRINLVLKYFLDNHDIPMSLDRGGLTPVHHAVRSGNLLGLELLLEKMKEQERHKLLTSVDKRGQTLVHLSAFSGYVEMTMLLLRNGGALSVEGEEDTVIHEIYYSRASFEPVNFFQNLFDEFVTLD